MTCIVGVTHMGNVYIGGDSAAVSGLDLFSCKDRKVFKVGGFGVGCCGSPRVSQLLAKSFHPPKFDPSGDLLGFMVVNFVNALRDCLKAGGVASRRDDVESFPDSAFLVGTAGRLFTIYSDYQVAEWRDGFASVGCGGPFALGSLHTSTGDPRKRIGIALRAAERFSAGVRGPFTIIKV